MLRIAHTLITFVIMGSNHKHVRYVVATGLLLLGAAFTPPARAATFTYQGMLSDPNGPVTNTTSMQFSLWDAASGGGQVGSSFQAWSVDVVNGLFTVDIDATNFGLDAFNGDPRWLRIDVDDGGWVTLSPRQPINPAPYALYAFDSAGGGGSCLWSEQGGDISFNTGDVGVGTAAPIYKLHVTDTAGGTAVAGENTGEYNYGYLGHEFAGVYASNNAPYADGKAIYGVATGPNGFGGYFEGQGYFSDNVGIGTTTPGYPLHVASTTRHSVYGETDHSTGRGVQGVATHATGSVSGVLGVTNSTAGRGVFGGANSATGSTTGVLGEAYSPDGYGVWGHNDADTGTNTAVGVYGSTAAPRGIGVKGYAPGPLVGYGVWGISDGSSGRGVVGHVTDTSGNAIGVEGYAISPTGYGVYAFNEAETGNAIAIQGDTASPDGFGGYFNGKGYFSGNVGIGTTTPASPLTVAGLVESTLDGFKFPDGTIQTTAGGGGGGYWQPNGSDIYYSTGEVGVGTSTPIYPLHAVSTGGNAAVAGENPGDSTYGYLGHDYAGVFGEGPFAGYFVGKGYFSGNVGIGATNPESPLHVVSNDVGAAVKFNNTSTGASGTGLVSESNSTTGSGVLGRNWATSGEAAGVIGMVWNPDGRGVRGENWGGSGECVGVYGLSDSPSGKAIHGLANSTSGANYGVYGEAAGDSGYGVYGEVTGLAGFGVYGLSDGGGGVYGKATSSTEYTVGVQGRAESPLGSGVHGENFATSGDAVGVKGISYASTGFGGYFIGRGYFSGNVGIGTTNPGYRLHVYASGDAAIAAENSSESTRGELGSPYGGVFGESSHSSGSGVFGQATGATGTNYGVRGETASAQGYGGYFDGRGYFSDNVGIGTTSPDTPLDILGGNWDVANTEGDLRIGNATYRLKMGVAVDGVGAGSCRIFAQGGNNRLTLGSNTTDIMTLVDGSVGIGVSNPDEKLEVNGRVRIENTLGGDALYINTPGDGIYVNASGTAFDCNGGTLGVRGYSPNGIGVHAENNGTTTANPALLVENNNAGGIAILSKTTSSDANTVITNMGAGDLIKGFSGASGSDLVFKVTNDGTTHTNVLQINGGSDLAEKFDVSEKAEPGAVVAIDPQNPGKLCIASGAYNRCVAGVISGANGVETGMVLADLPGAENSQPVALSGRVWVNCDASQKAIEPGDLLTTAERPGHAMAVTDYSRAHGAVIGKAMSRLAQGETGMVLVLVNLQ